MESWKRAFASSVNSYSGGGGGGGGGVGGAYWRAALHRPNTICPPIWPPSPWFFAEKVNKAKPELG